MNPVRNTTGTSPSSGWIVAFFRFCLHSYPSAFRGEFGSDMVRTFVSKLADVGKSLTGKVLFLFRECVGAGIGGLRLRARSWRKRGDRSDSQQERIELRELSSTRRGWSRLPDMGRDLKHSVRALIRRPSLSIGGIVVLGFGIGLTTVLFCLVAAMAFRPLPVPGGRRIMHLEQVDPEQVDSGLPVSLHDLRDWREQQTTFEDLGGFYTGTVNLSGIDRPERFFGAWVTTNTFDLLQVRPFMGRAFLPEEGLPGAPGVALISYAVWQSRFGADGDIIGRVMRVNGEPTTIAGIMPEGFGFPYWEDIWLPLAVDPQTFERGQGPGLEVFGRLRDGVTLNEAKAEFDGISTRLDQAYPESTRGRRAYLEPYPLSYQDSDLWGVVAFLLLTGFSVLLIACFNVANLLLARAVTRSRDLAIRVAIGAGRGQVMKEVFQEALLLAVGGACFGTALTIGIMEILNRTVMVNLTYPPPFWMIFRVDAPILLFVLASTVLAAILSGLIPAYRASRTGVQTVLRTGMRGGSGLKQGRLSRLLVTAQLVVSAALMVTSGHVALRVVNKQTVDYPYPVDQVLTARVGLFDEYFPDRDARQAFYRDVCSRLEAHPGVVSTFLATSLPGEEAQRLRLGLQGDESVGRGEGPYVRSAWISPGFFRALDVPVVQGRDFTASDDTRGAAVALINQSLAEQFFPDQEPLGKQIRLGDDDTDSPWLTVVGVVPDLNMDGAYSPAGDPQGAYRPIPQGDLGFVSIGLCVEGAPLTYAATLREEVMELQGDTPIYFVRTLRDAVNSNLINLIIIGGIFITFGVAAFLMASVGLFAVTSFLADQRTREVGLRMALGARARNILGLILRQGLVQVLTGLALGLLLASAMIRLITGSVAVAVEAWNLPLTLAVCVVLGLTGITAVVCPALRTMRVDPMDALRVE